MNAPDSRGTDSGTAYGRPAPSCRAELTQVGPGTPMGELLRRYWHPIGLTGDAGDTPKKVRVLGEDLILFREKGSAGRAGLLYPRCMHRGTNLYYGHVEERGIRCCYHGWLYDVLGHCLEQPCEPGMGERRDNIRQPWYAIEERYGLIFAYLGPPGRRPVLPRYDCLEQLEPGETVETDDTSIGSGGGVIVPCNWLQHYENVADPFHVPILHGTFSGVQFVEQMAKMPEVRFETSPRGVKITAVRKTEDGRTFRRITEAVLPTLRVVPNPRVGRYGRVESIGWVLPIDDTSFRIYTAGRVTEQGALGRNRSKMNGKYWWDLSDEEHQRFPGDWEAQTGQGEITMHSEEHLRTSDKGVALLRRLLQKQLEAVAAGGDPMLVAFDENHALVRFEAGNFLDGA